jgi:GNAT superfamily N-acetyltransferase
MNPPRVDTATPDDVEALVALRTAVAEQMTRDHGLGDWSAPPTTALVRKQLRASRILVARQGDTLLGTVRITEALQTLFDASAFTPAVKALYVLGLAVSPAAQGQGIGTRLMQAAKDHARAVNANALWLDAVSGSAGAGPFYSKCGFRPVGVTLNRTTPLVFYEWRV